MLHSLLLCVAAVFSLLPLALSTPSVNIITGLTNPYGLVYDGQGHLYTSQTSLNTVVKMNANGLGTMTTFNFSAMGLTSPRGLDVDNQFNLYVAEQLSGPSTSAGGYVKFDSNGNVLQTVTGISMPFGVTTDPQRNVWVAVSGNNSIAQYNQQGQQIAASPTDVAPYVLLYSPHGIASDATGVLYIMSAPTALQQSQTAYIVTRLLNGTYLIFAQGLTYPEDLVVGCDGFVYVADTGANRIVQINRNGTVTNTYTPQDKNFSAPTGVALDEFGNLFAADFNNGRIVKFPGVTIACPQFARGSSSGGVLPPAAVSSSAAPAAASSSAAAPSVSSAPAPAASSSAAAPSVSSTPAPSVTSSGAASTSTGPASLSFSFCYITYGLPGTIDYPWSQAISLQVTLAGNAGAFQQTAFGAAQKFVSGVGTRVYTNRFGVSTTQSVSLTQATNDMYYNSSFPVDQSGLTITLPNVQLPGTNPATTYNSLQIFNGSYAILSGPEASIDPQATAFLTTIPNFVNRTIGPANLNALSVNYDACQAGITFSNGLRPPFQATGTNNGLQYNYTYTITDGASYTVTANLVLFAQARASLADSLGNVYQVITNVTGTRTYTPIGAVIGTPVTSRVSSSGAVGRLYPFSYLNSNPGVYTPSTAPYLDAAGLQYTVAPGTPSSTVTVEVATNLQTGFTTLLETGLPQPTSFSQNLTIVSQ